MKIELINLLKEVFYLVLIAVVPVLTTYAVRFISRGREALLAYIDEKDAQTENISLEKAKKYVDKAADMIEDIVVTVNQIYVDDLKKNKENWNKDTQLEAFSKAYNTAMAMMSDDMKESILVVYKDIDSWLGCSIEKYVSKNKSTVNTVVNELNQPIDDTTLDNGVDNIVTD